MFSIVSLIIMGVIIVLAFRLQGYFVNYAYELRRQGVKTGKLINILESLSMSGIVVVVNIILRLIVNVKIFRSNSFLEHKNTIPILSSTVPLQTAISFYISLILPSQCILFMAISHSLQTNFYCGTFM